MTYKITSSITCLGTTRDGYNYEDHSVGVYYDADEGCVVANIEGRIYSLDSLSELLADMKYLEMKETK